MDFLFPKLYPDIDLTGFEKIKEVLSQPNDTVLHDKYSLKITVGDCRSLAGNNWVNDQIINLFQLMMNEKHDG